jgi:predicted secreted protein
MQNRIVRISPLLLGLLWLAPYPACADENEPRMNRVSFQVEASRDVENDLVTAVLATTEEDSNPATLADRINETMSWALETARAAKGIDVKSGGYNTNPVHDKTRIVRWRGSQSLILESADVEAISKLIGELQSRIQVQSVRFSISPKRRRAIQDELIAEALAAFKARAQIVRTNLDAAGYELVEISINTGGGEPAPMHGYARAMVAEIAQPAFESGTSELSVNVNVTIKLR